MKDTFVGIDVGGTNIKIMLMDCEKTIIADHSIPTEKEKGRNSITDKIINTIIQMLTNNQVSKNRVACVCMGLPGAINIREQKTIHLAYFDWNNLNLTDEIGKFFNCSTGISWTEDAPTAEGSIILLSGVWSLEVVRFRYNGTRALMNFSLDRKSVV